jgi:hypothetical protein
MARVEVDLSMREQPGGPVVLIVDGEVARAMGFAHAKPVSGPSTKQPILYEVRTEPRPGT